MQLIIFSCKIIIFSTFFYNAELNYCNIVRSLEKSENKNSEFKHTRTSILQHD